tara:strand:- start:252 stop:470 length:219 start_codon:yes stop_codon:yes gene_type:complete
MEVNIWVGKDYLDQLYKNLKAPSVAESDTFNNAVEYTDIAVMEGQMMVSIKYDKYIELVDKGLLVEWSGVQI